MAPVAANDPAAAPFDGPRFYNRLRLAQSILDSLGIKVATGSDLPLTLIGEASTLTKSPPNRSRVVLDTRRRSPTVFVKDSILEARLTVSPIAVNSSLRSDEPFALCIFG